ncbi:hypothetical protein ACFL54_04070 [Planctomycetota bacterium]
MRTKIIALVMLMLIIFCGQVFGKPNIKAKDWINGKLQIKKVMICWFVEPAMDDEGGAEVVMIAWEKFKEDPNVGFVMLSSWDKRQIQSWVDANNVQFPVGCRISIKSLNSFAVRKWPKVVILGHDGASCYNADPKDEEKLTGAIEKALIKYQKSYMPKIKKSESKAEKLVKGGKYAEAYVTYQKARAQISLLDYAKNLEKEMAFLEDKVVGEFDQKVFEASSSKIKKVAGEVKNLLKIIDTGKLSDRLEQRQRVINSATEDIEMLVTLQMAHVSRLVVDALFDVAYKGLVRILESVKNDDNLSAEVLTVMSRIEQMVANRVRYLVKNKGDDFDQSIGALKSYFSGTPMPGKITVWIDKAEELALAVEDEPEEFKKPEKATSFSSAVKKEENYDAVPVDELAGKADRKFNKAQGLIQDLSGEDPNFNYKVKTALALLREASRMYASAISRCDGPIAKLQEKLRGARRQMFFCRKMVRN